MRYRWPENTQFTRVDLTVEQEACSLCQRRLHICDQRFHPILSLQGPLQLVCKLAHCPDPDCPADAHTDREEPFKPEELLDYKDARPPRQEQEAMHRRQVVRRARSRKQRPILLAELERHYLAAPSLFSGSLLFDPLHPSASPGLASGAPW